MKCLHFSKTSRKTLFETFLDFTFFLCISPYRISWGSNKQHITQWKFQKVLAAVFAITDLFGSVTKIRLNLDKNLDNPVGYFNFLWSIAVTMMHVAFYFVLWTKQHHVLKAVETFRKSFSNSCNMTRLPCNPVVGYTLCILSLVLGILPSLKVTVNPPGGARPMVNWNPCLVFRTHVAHAKFMFFLSNSSSIPQNSSYYSYLPGESRSCMDDLDAFEIVQGFGHLAVYTARYIGAYYVDLFMTISSVTLWLGANEFVKESTRGDISVQTSEISPLTAASSVPIGHGRGDMEDPFRDSEMVSKYADLKCLANAINSATSPILFCYVFEAIFYYAINLNSIFTAHDWHARIQVAHFLLGYTSVLGFSADVTRKMDGFRQWLVNGNTIKQSIGSDLLVSLIHETQSKTIAVSAFGIFTIDYPLIFNIVTTTVTFFLIVVQFVPNAC